MVKIFVGNIADGAPNRDLRSMFEKYGAVSECSILTNFGFVHMDNEEDAFAAVKALDGAFFSGATIKVEMSHGKPSRRGGRGGGGGGRGGGRGGFRGRGGGGFRERDRDRGRDRYDDYAPRRDYYSRDPYARDPYDRDPYGRDPYGRDPYARDPYERRPPPRDPYDRRPRDPYDSYSTRDPYGSRDPYSSRMDPYSRDRSPVMSRRMDDYGGAHRRSFEGNGYDIGGRGGSPLPTRRY